MTRRIKEEDMVRIYLAHHDEDIIEALAEKLGIDLRQAMHIYYESLLAKQIANGDYGIQFLDAHYLADDLLENESELVNSLLHTMNEEEYTHVH
jgi:hypothetical protein